MPHVGKFGPEGPWNVLNLAPEKFNVIDAGLALVLAGEGQHFISHIQTISLPGGADALGRQRDIDGAEAVKSQSYFWKVCLLAPENGNLEPGRNDFRHPIIRNDDLANRSRPVFIEKRLTINHDVRRFRFSQNFHHLGA